MSGYKIISCKGCDKPFRIYDFEVYPGDPDYCRVCNEASETVTEKPEGKDGIGRN